MKPTPCGIHDLLLSLCVLSHTRDGYSLPFFFLFLIMRASLFFNDSKRNGFTRRQLVYQAGSENADQSVSYPKNNCSRQGSVIKGSEYGCVETNDG